MRTKTDSKRPGYFARHPRLRRAIKIVGVLAVLFSVWLGWEVYHALTAKPYIHTDYNARAMELVRAAQPAGPDHTEKWLELFQRTVAAEERLYDEVIERLQPEGLETVHIVDVIINTDELLERIDAGQPEFITTPAEQRRKNLLRLRDAFIAWIDTGEGASILAEADELARAGGIVIIEAPLQPIRPLGVDPDAPMSIDRQAIRVVRLQLVRMHLAAERGDWETYLAAIDTASRIGELLAVQTESKLRRYGRLVPLVVFPKGVDWDVLSRQVPPSVIREIAQRMDGIVLPSIGRHLDAERLAALDALQRTHDRRGRLIVSSAHRVIIAVEMIEQLHPIWNASSVFYPRATEVVDQTEEYFARAKDKATLSPRAFLDLPDDAWESSLFSTFNLVKLSFGAGVDSAIERSHRLSVHWEAVRTILAIKLFRAERNRLPGSLAELVPAYLDEVPMDPWAAQGPLVYRLDDTELGYTLYTVGHDGEDNGGLSAEWKIEALDGEAPGTDYVFTDTER